MNYYGIELEVSPEQVVIVSVMPAAKKFEAQRPEFSTDGVPDVDFVITAELAQMIRILAWLQLYQRSP